MAPLPPSAPLAARGRAPSGWQGPLRAAGAIFLVGFLVVWLIKPIGNPCPYLANLPQESSASSSPSMSPPGSRTCTYTVATGTEVQKAYVPWLDWIVLLLLAAVVAGAVRFLSPAGRSARAQRAGHRQHEPRPPRAERGLPATRTPRAEPPLRAERPPPASRDPSPGRSTERDPAERERARRERAERDRGRRDR